MPSISPFFAPPHTAKAKLPRSHHYPQNNSGCSSNRCPEICGKYCWILHVFHSRCYESIPPAIRNLSAALGEVEPNNSIRAGVHQCICTAVPASNNYRADTATDQGELGGVRKQGVNVDFSSKSRQERESRCWKHSTVLFCFVLLFRIEMREHTYRLAYLRERVEVAKEME